MKNQNQPRWRDSEIAAALLSAIVWSLLGVTLTALNPTLLQKGVRRGIPDVTNSLQAMANGGRHRHAIANCRDVVQSQLALPSCRIHNQFSSGIVNLGSGTLIDVTASGERGLILTCAHLFAEGTGRVVVEFPDGKTYGALLTAIDRQADLAALEIARPNAQPAPLDRKFKPSTNLTACGFGPQGAFRCVAGPVIGFSAGAGQTSVRMAGAVRSGDSGGGVFDDRGWLVAVVWGECNGVTYASTGRPLARFLDRLLERRANNDAASPPSGGTICPDGTCPLIGANLPWDGAPAGRRPAGGEHGAGETPWNAPLGREELNQSCDCGESLATIAARLNELERELPSTFGAAARAAAALATVLLGVSGPVGWGIVAASTVGGWLIGRGLKRKRLRVASRELREKEPTSRQLESSRSQLAAHDSQPAAYKEATAAAGPTFQTSVVIEEQSPIERDDREARELLRLSRLEGRDPLQDAVAGRLALDRLDAIAEGNADLQQVAWADGLRRELRERFNEIAPTKFNVNAEC